MLLNQLIIRSIWECIFPIVNKEKYLLFLLRSTTKKKKKKKTKWKNSNMYEYWQQQSSFQVEWSNWGSYGKTAHFSFKWAKPALLHSFYTVLPIFSLLPIAQFSATKVWLWIITRGPWWSYIAHLSKQICILTVEVSAKFTALNFTALHPPHHPPCLFLFNASRQLELNIERNISAKLYWNWSSGF